MALSTFSELKTAIAAWMWGRTDLGDHLNDFIALAEARLNRELRLREMEASEDLTLTDGEADLPADYLSLRGVTALTSPKRPLAYTSPDGLDRAYPSDPSGWPCVFTIEGAKIKVRPTTASDIRLAYYAKIPALSDANTSNWLLAKAPNAYLHASCLEAAKFIGDTPRAGEMSSLLVQDLELLRSEDKMARWGRAGARVQGPTP